MRERRSEFEAWKESLIRTRDRGMTMGFGRRMCARCQAQGEGVEEYLRRMGKWGSDARTANRAHGRTSMKTKERWRHGIP